MTRVPVAILSLREPLGSRIARGAACENTEFTPSRMTAASATFLKKIIAESDDEAISKAEATQGTHKIEIWEGTRLICQLPPLKPK